MKTARVFGVILIGVAAAWGGYWIGHALGWTRGADWPWTVGRGGGALVLSAAAATLALLGVLGFAATRPMIRRRRLAKVGIHAQGLVLDIHDTGLTMHRHGAVLHQSEVDLEVHPESSEPYVAHAYEYLNDRELSHFLPGSAVSVRFDPNHPKRVAIEHELIFN